MQSKDDYHIIAEAISYLTIHQKEQHDLKTLSQHLGVSPFHLQRVFSRWTGVSPKQYLQFLTKEFTKMKLKEATVMNSTLVPGLSSASRLHDLIIHCERITSRAFKTYGKGLTITYGSGSSPFGSCFLAVTNRGICELAFFDNECEYHILEKHLRCEWKNATLINSDETIFPYLTTIFGKKEQRKPIELLLKGSPFQIKVWEALLSIPEGHLVSYQDIALSIEKPKAMRATASAIAKNNIAYLIPCHRVIRQNGNFGQYRWQSSRKKAMILWENCKNVSIK